VAPRKRQPFAALRAGGSRVHQGFGKAEFGEDAEGGQQAHLSCAAPRDSWGRVALWATPITSNPVGPQRSSSFP
jgi:hypothetical protein